MPLVRLQLGFTYDPDEDASGLPITGMTDCFKN
jgi:hypothetical protein